MGNAPPALNLEPAWHPARCVGCPFFPGIFFFHTMSSSAMQREIERGGADVCGPKYIVQLLV